MPRPGRSRHPLILAIVAAMAQPASLEAAEAWSMRADRETRAILRTLIVTDAKPLQPCLFADQWEQSRPIEADVARQHLGLNLHVAILAPEDGRRPADIIDPADAPKETFCGDEDFEKERKQAFADFSEGKIEGQARPNGASGREMKRRRMKFGRPVYNRTLTSALVIVSYDTITRTRDTEAAKQKPDRYLPNGVRKRDDIFFIAMHYFFRKRGNVWSKVSENWEAIAE